MSFFVRDSSTSLDVAVEGREVVPDEQRIVHAVGEIDAGETHIGEVSNPSDIIDVTLTIEAGAYDSGDVLSDTATLTNAMRVTGGKGEVRSITVLDQGDQGVAFDIVFFKVTHSLGTKNSAPDIDDTEMLDILGIVSIDTGDYVDLGANRVATKRNVGLAVEANTGSRNLFIGTITRGTPTYGATDALRLKIGFGGLS